MAGSFNKVILMGNLVRDPELRYTPQGTAVTDIRLAISDPRSRGNNAQADKDNTVFIDVTLWERSAEVVCEYLRKGRPLLVEGRLVTESWDDKDTGKKVSRLKVVAQSFQFVDSRGAGEGEPSGGGDSSGEAPRGNRGPAAGRAPYGGGRAAGRESGEGGGAQRGGYNQQPPRQQRPNDDFGDFPADNDDIPF